MEKDFIIEVLKLFESKLKNNQCTKEQTDAIYEVLTENLDLFATADELAEHYGKSKEAVHGIIKRKMLAKPKRNITMYNFKAFRKVVPNGWTKRH